MKVCVYGLWHLGLVTVAGLFIRGFEVIGLDDWDMTRLRNGELPIDEPAVPENIKLGVKTGAITFTPSPAVAVSDADVVWVTFDTPIDRNDRVDAGYVEEKVMAIAGYIKNNALLIISSQVPVGFTGMLEKSLKGEYPDKKIYIAYSPENLRLGAGLPAFINPDRIVVGAHTNERERFDPVFKKLSSELVYMSIRSAEMTKHALNAYLALSITFANEIARLCEQEGAVAGEVELGLMTDKRIGFNAYIKSGDAYSGGTLARDVQVLKGLIDDSDVNAPVISGITASNQAHKAWIQSKCLEAMKGSLSGKTVFVVGLAYKFGTNTLRRSGAIEFCEWLHDQKAIVYAYDPAVRAGDLDLPRWLNIITDPKAVIDASECIVIFKDIISIRVDKLVGKKVIIDPNGALNRSFDINDCKYFSVKGQRS